MARLVTWAIIALAALNVGFLACLPMLAGSSANRLDFPRPASLLSKPQPPEEREEPLAPVSELEESLRLPRIDTAPTDEHSRASLAAYWDGDYDKAFEEAVLALDPTPLEDNELHRLLTESRSDGTLSLPTVEKPDGRFAVAAVDEALEPILSEGEADDAARLNNLSAMLILDFYASDPPLPTETSERPSTPWMAEELAYQAADIAPSSCPALLNLTLFNGMGHARFDSLTAAYFGADVDLEHAVNRNQRGFEVTDYGAGRCEDPALLYYAAQNSIGAIDVFDSTGSIDRSLELAGRLQKYPRWSGLAHSAKGDAYYWGGIYAIERTQQPRPFTARRYFELALDEYDAALALQPDDPAIRHGKALVYLELGKAETRDKIDVDMFDKAIAEAERALESAPDVSRFRQTLIEAYEERGENAKAAELQRRSLATDSPDSTSISLVPYSPISHGIGHYIELRLDQGSGAAGGFFDDDVIEPFVPKPYVSSVGPGWGVPGGLNQYRSEFRQYGLLRNDLLSGDYATLGKDLERAPEEVRNNERVLLINGIASLLNQEDPATPTAETQTAITNFLDNAYSFTVVSNPSGFDPSWQGNDDFYLHAGNFFRQYKQYEKAIQIYDIWRMELERGGADAERRAEVEKLLGEVYFLKGDNEEALARFDRASELRADFPPYVVRQAFIHEEQGEYAEAEALYRGAIEDMRQPAEWMEPYDLESLKPLAFYFPDNYQATKHLGDMLLIQAESGEETGDEQETREKYREAAKTYRLALMTDLEQQGTVYGANQPGAAAAASNLGISLLKAGEYEEGIEVLRTLVLPPAAPDLPEEDRAKERAEVLEALAGTSDVPEEWKESYSPTLPAPDESNPVFRLNLGWAYDLNGEPKKAKEQYLSAIRSDPSFHPALNDLGVLAAEGGGLEEAKGYFDAALDLKPDYAHASHNMGAALLSSGDLLAAQSYLANAVRHDPSLSATSYDYILDNELYFLDLSLSGRVPPNWEFAKDAENGMGIASLLVMALLLGRIAIGYVGSGIRDAFIEKSFSEATRFGSTVGLPRLFDRLRGAIVRFMSFGVPSSSSWRMTILAFFVSVPFIVVVMGWSLLWEDSGAKLSMLAALFYLAGVSLLVHHAGHALAASWFRMRVLAAPWPAGIVQALALVIIGGPAVAPMPANMVEGPRGRDRERALIFLAGPAANILFASMLFVLFLTSHIPSLRLGAILNLTAAAVSLLILPPLDGAMARKGRHVRLIFWVGMALAVAATAVYFSNELYCQRSPGEICWNIGL